MVCNDGTPSRAEKRASNGSAAQFNGKGIRMNIASNVLELIGNTPLVRIGPINRGKAEVVAKLESFNPGGSAKDRVGVSMLRAAFAQGLIQEGATIIEPTSGNTGIGLAVACAVLKCRLILTMPETMSVERRRLAAAYGAEVVLTPGDLGMKGAIEKAEELRDSTPNSFIPQQFENEANPAAHLNTANEIWRDAGGCVDAFVAGIGTGGTITGVGRRLRELNPSIHLAGVEPDASPLLSKGKAGPHKIQGIGANFVPKILDRSLLSEVIAVSAESAGETAREAARQEGILIGISGGAALHAALRLSESGRFDGKRIVVLLPDSGERYLSTWLWDVPAESAG